MNVSHVIVSYERALEIFLYSASNSLLRVMEVAQRRDGMRSESLDVVGANLDLLEGILLQFFPCSSHTRQIARAWKRACDGSYAIVEFGFIVTILVSSMSKCTDILFLTLDPGIQGSEKPVAGM